MATTRPSTSEVTGGTRAASRIGPREGATGSPSVVEARWTPRTRTPAWSQEAAAQLVGSQTILGNRTMVDTAPRCSPWRDCTRSSNGRRHEQVLDRDPAARLRPRPRAESREDDGRHPRSGQARGSGHLYPRALSLAVLLPARRPEPVRPGRAHPGTHQRAAGQARQGAGGCHRRLALRAASGRPLPQHRGGAGRRRKPARPLPQDAHPGRPAVLREVLLHPRRPGLSRLPDPFQAHQRSGVLGPVVSRSERG